MAIVKGPARPMFCDLPDAERMAYRGAVADAGGEVAGYCGEGMQVALPRPAGPFYRAMEAAGLELDETTLHYFPVGSDAPPDHLRHDGSYPGSRGFWLYGTFRPAR